MIALGCDHGGYELKEKIIQFLKGKDIPYKDLGCYHKEVCDYPEKGRMVARAVASGEYEKGIVICTTGIGISIAANKVVGIRAALCSDIVTAELSRAHNDANVLAIGSVIIDEKLAIEIVDTFLHTDFSEEERHQWRISQIEG